MKSYLKIGGSTRDTQINALLYSVSARIARYLGRASGTTQMIESKSRTQDFDVRRGQSVFRLNAVPVSSITSASYDPFLRTFTSSLGTGDYTFDSDTGELRMRYILHNRPWPDVYTGALRVVYTGGIAATLQALQSYAPDLELAAQLQIKHELTRVDLGPEAHTVTGAGVSTTYPEQQLTNQVKELLAPYRLEGLGI